MKKEYDVQGRLVSTTRKEETLTETFYDYEAESLVRTERLYENNVLIKVIKTYGDLPEGV